MFLVAILLIVGITSAQLRDKPYYDPNDAHNLFKDFVREYNKVYSPEEYSRRLEIFRDSLKEINERNAKHPSTEYGITHFADLTEAESSNYRGLLPLDDAARDKLLELSYPAERITAPEQFDWRDYGVVSPVKSQGDCGDCFIFSAIGNAESQYALKYNQCLVFSEQECLDCLPPLDGRNNCQGGSVDGVWYAMAYDLQIGLMLQDDYPYTGEINDCSIDPSQFVTNITSFQTWQPDEETLKQLLYETGPLSVALDSSDLDAYVSGIIHPHKCTDQVDHAALLVGYGIENGEKYWLIKNSYGENWGENGYFRLLRGVNACAMGTSYTASCTVS